MTKFLYPENEKIILPHCPPGLTTIYDAAMKFTGRGAWARDKMFGLSGETAAPTWGQLRDFVGIDSETFSLIVDFWHRLQDGRLRARLPNYYGREQIDPFKSLLSETDLQAIYDERQRLGTCGIETADMSSPTPSEKPTGTSEAPAVAPHRNKSGPRPDKRESIKRKMVQEYQGRAEVLAGEKIISLTNRYGAAKDTVKKSRDQALVELWKDSGTTLDTGK
jgi:hypothetical protein